MTTQLSEIEFPLLKYYISPIMVKKLMDGLRKYGPPDLSDDSRDTLSFIYINYERDKNLLMLSDYFNQGARMKATFLNSGSTWDYFQENREKLIKKLGPRPSYEQIYGELWSNTRMCSSFPVMVAKVVVDMFKPSRVFDPCAGWGDRMLACIAAGIPYIGVDPNKDLQKGYQSMIDFFDLDPDDYKVIPSPFEEISTDQLGKFPLIFTSPPFFNMEEYADDETQSNIKFPTYDKWKRGFLFPMIKGCVDMLEKGGKLVIYVNNIRKYPILDDTRGFLDTPGLSGRIGYLGKVYWKNSKYPKCLLVYQSF